MANDDVRDALKQPNGRELVLQAVENAKPWKPGSDGGTSKPIELTTMQQVTSDRLADHRKGPVPRIGVGIPALDKVLDGGFDLGTMAVVAALSSHGKSAFALQSCHFQITELKTPVLFVSIEMSLKQLADRTFSHISNAPKANWHQLVERLEDDTQRHFKGAAPFYLIGGIITLEDVEAAIREAFEKGARVAYIDYAQKISTGPRDDMNASMQKVSAKLAALAAEYEAVIVCLAQLNKRVATREDFTPQMHDVYYGTSLINDSDYALFNVWPFKLNKKNPPDDYLILVAKNRNGDSDVGIKCQFNAPRQRISEKFPEYQPDDDWNGDPEQGTFADFNAQAEGGFYHND